MKTTGSSMASLSGAESHLRAARIFFSQPSSSRNMPQPPEQGPGDKLTLRGSLNILYYAALVHSRCITPFLRNKVGENNRLLTLLAFIVLLVYAANDERLIGCVVLWVIGVLVEKY